MFESEILQAFLRRGLGAKRERILDFVSHPKAHSKFLDLLYHELGTLFRATCIVRELPDIAWQQPAFRFKPPKDFGFSLSSLQAAYDINGQNELVITQDARFGYWRDETFLDSTILLDCQMQD